MKLNGFDFGLNLLTFKHDSTKLQVMDPNELIQWLSQIYGDDHSGDRKVESIEKYTRASSIDGKEHDLAFIKCHQVGASWTKESCTGP